MDVEHFISNINKMKFKEIKDSINMLTGDVDAEKIEMYTIISNALKCDERKNVSGLGKTLENKVSAYVKEVDRLKSLYNFDKSFGDYKYVAGVDEVGRGPLAGPIVAAAVILKLHVTDDKELIQNINDSKKLSEALREKTEKVIKEKALSYSIVAIDNEEIDKRGIAFANNEAMKLACERLNIKPELVLSDGYRVKGLKIRNEHVIKGDTKSAAIGCASIIAKVFRDKLMKEYDSVYPGYGFSKHVGYGTQEHIEGIRKMGVTPIHRQSFLRNILSY